MYTVLMQIYSRYTNIKILLIARILNLIKNSITFAIRSFFTSTSRLEDKTEM